MYNLDWFKTSLFKSNLSAENIIPPNNNPNSKRINIDLPVDIYPKIENLMTLSNKQALSFEFEKMIGRVLIQDQLEERKKISFQQSKNLDQLIRPKAEEMKEIFHKCPIKSNF